MTKLLPLKRIARLQYGESLAADQRVDGEYPVMGSGGISGTHHRANFRAPGIVVGRKGSYGSIHWASIDGFAIDTAYYIDGSCTSAHLRWLYYALQAVDLRGVSQDVGVPGLSRESAYAALIPAAPPQEQRRIADYLDTETALIDAMQSRTRRQIAALVERLNESVRLATSIGSGARRKTGIAWMPEMNERWQLLKISHAFRTGSGTTPTSDRSEYFDGPHPWVNSADLNDGEIIRTEKSVTTEALSDFSSLKIHPAGSLVVALYGQGSTKGKVGILRIDACLNQACCALIPIGPISEDYASYWFRGHKQGIVGLALGAGQPNLSQDLIRQLRIPAPDRPEQDQIVAELHELEEETRTKLKLLRAREQLLSERRAALITAAIAGQIDISTASGRGIED
ncbi:type I restriction enzyme S subunit [Micromonospora profundi]|uniref:restriction endonuclease subunit S n=1 Tax=Micromonospora profundi TaxID=1420889 RepID=UPI0014399478|nr:restriction endonuclease subunit S [Micromonospora profundi]NJC13125.1 type I restriction enzyme S subunit [Micromonospora profundi]